jgi:hypothetical protein
MALCPLYCHQSPLQPSAPFMALWSLYDPLAPIWALAPSVGLSPLYDLMFSSAHCPTALYPLYCPLSPLRPSVSSTTFCLLYGLLPLNGPLTLLQPSAFLQPSALSKAHCALYDRLSPLRLFVPSMDLCPLCCSISFTTLCLLYGLLPLLWPSDPFYGLVPFHGPYSL